MSILGIKAKFETVRVEIAANVGAGYSVLGAPLANAARLVYILNTIDSGLMFSTDGFNDHFAVPENGYIVFDLTTNKLEGEDGWFFGASTQFWIRQLGAPTTGAVYLSVLYGSN